MMKSKTAYLTFDTPTRCAFININSSSSLRPTSLT